MSIARLLCVLCLVALSPALDTLQAQQFAQPGKFDFYVFTLSWSPQFCASTGNQKAECHVPANNFVVHGLWPQYKSGSYPAKCSNLPGPPQASDEADIMGDPSLVEHEWQIHGTCSNLGVTGYFGMIRSVRNSIKIPDKFVHLTQSTQMAPSDIKSSFLAANPNLSISDLAIGCAGNTLVQIQVCVAKDGTATPCTGVKDCHASMISVLPILQ